jgi:hypothetical protein
VWDGERLFQSAKFTNEMQYQHLVFEEFARKIQPQINPFVVPDGFDVTINPSIVAEFAHVVYRFGHSMLTESIDRFDPNFNADDIGLIQGFLNPVAFDSGHAITDDMAAGAIIRGMTRQVGNEIDEFVTGALRNNLLGLPLDLATINLARGRDTGVPSLNAARREFYDATNNAAELRPYDSWVDFAGNLKHEASIINFIAAYGTHSLITGQATIEGKRDAALTIITGASVGALLVPDDAVDFLNGSGAWASGANGVTTTGLDNVDLWIGGLAEKILPFGGMLGSTFNFVFEQQMESLQNGDRFYYLQRLDGLHLFGEMENNSFAEMIMTNTNATHLPSDVFSTPGLALEVDITRQFNDLDGNGTLESTDPVGGGILTPLVVRNNPGTAGPTATTCATRATSTWCWAAPRATTSSLPARATTRSTATAATTTWKAAPATTSSMPGRATTSCATWAATTTSRPATATTWCTAARGWTSSWAARGRTSSCWARTRAPKYLPARATTSSWAARTPSASWATRATTGSRPAPSTARPATTSTRSSRAICIVGHDVFLGDGGFDEFIAEGGDDILVGSPGRGKMAGMSGFDWMTYKDNTAGVNADFTRGIVFDENPAPPLNGTLDAYESMEGLSGSKLQ